jgi:hypothetical protein
MDEDTRNGYARLVHDLAKLNHHDRFQEMLKRAYGAMDELGQLIERAKNIGSEQGKNPNRE